jgi:hypothetical protein
VSGVREDERIWLEASNGLLRPDPRGAEVQAICEPGTPPCNPPLAGDHTRPASEGTVEAIEAAVMLLLLHPGYAKQRKGLLLGGVACTRLVPTKAGSKVHALARDRGQLGPVAVT